MKLSTTQRDFVEYAALIEGRPPSQMLALLLAEGLRFYFCDREPAFIHITDESRNIDEMSKTLEQEAHQLATAMESAYTLISRQ